MRRLLPPPAGDVDPYDAARPDAGGPLLRVNFVVSADGLAADEDGRSGGLGGPGDRELFRALRAHADGILVGAGTARTEGYGPHRLRPDLAARRAADGRDRPAAIVLVTRSLALDLAGEVFTAAATPTVVVTCAAAPAAARAAAARAGVLVVAGEDEVDLPLAVRLLREDHGLAHLLCEGGPRLVRGVLGAGLADELCLTLAPLVLGADGPRFVGRLPGRVGLELAAVHEQDGELFLRYRIPATST